MKEIKILLVIIVILVLIFAFRVINPFKKNATEQLNTTSQISKTEPMNMADIKALIEKGLNQNNLYAKYVEPLITVEEWIKDNITVCKTIDENHNYIIWSNENTGEKMLADVNKKIILTNEKVSSTEIGYIERIKHILEILEKFEFLRYEKYNDKECVVIEMDYGTDYEVYKEQSFLDLETGLLLKTYLNGELLVEYDVKLNSVTDNDVKKIDTTGYNVI